MNIFEIINNKKIDEQIKEYTKRERILLLRGAFSQFDYKHNDSDLSKALEYLNSVLKHLETKDFYNEPYKIQANEKEPGVWTGLIPNDVMLARREDNKLEIYLKVVGYIIEQKYPLTTMVDREDSIIPRIHNIKLSFLKI